jgi:PGF-CTERM protein
MGYRFKTSMISLLVTGLLLSMGGEATASGLTMDMDLRDSAASFLGENAGDRSGISIAGVGDVNGDGYDDILIGAYENNDTAFHSGKAYLIFGKATGWSMDIDLSNADASFTGEAKYDQVGRSVAGAGDVNGDGLDDFLIGAPFNAEGGQNYGQTYLFFGRASGWSTDVNVSKANASFIGEDINEASGYHVAGVGDVNADGFDDFLISATFGDEGGARAGETFLLLGKASGWSMDSNLSTADASFIGEASWDDSGFCVASAGDANGDGYDDFLISALFNDEGGNGAGQTYMILGKKTGWAMNTSLTSADASFWGEAASDNSGFSVGSAGDVNGDGYDDILIGALANDEGAKGAGQTYLILGKATGWSMDTNLSSVNASFWGEDSSDVSGVSVAGAGDVNGDGYDDILIGASGDEDGGGKDSGQTYLIYGRPSGWSMYTSLSNANASFWGEDSSDFAGRSVAFAGDVNGDGYDDILIGAPYDEEGGYQAGQTYLIFYDKTRPMIDQDNTPPVAYTGDDFIFNVSASDNSGVKNVTIEYWYGLSPLRENITTNLTSGDKTNGTWAKNITIPLNSTDTLHYFIYIEDISDNTNSSKQKDVEVRDNDVPSITDSTFFNSSSTGKTFGFIATSTDNIAVSDVKLIFWYGAGMSTNVSMNTPLPGFHSFEITIPHSLETLHYRLFVEDTSSNFAITSVINVTIHDYDPPMFIQDLTNPNAYAGHDYVFRVNVTDNINLTAVHCEYWYGNGPHTNATMAPQSDNMWTSLVHIPLETSQSLHYFFYAIDNSSNENVTEVKDITVHDVDRPTFVDNLSDTVATTGDPFSFKVQVMDWIEVSTVHVIYTLEGSLPVNATMTLQLDDVWVHDITIPSDSLAPLHYTFVAVDTSGNWNRSVTVTLIPTDNDAPTFGEDMTSTQATTGEEFTFTITVLDNMEVMEAAIVYLYGEGVATKVQLSKATITIEDTLDNLTYEVTAVDTAGNANITLGHTVNIIDNDLPEVIEDLSDVLASTGDPFVFLLKVSDNVGISKVTVIYAYGNGARSNISMALEAQPGDIWATLPHTIDIPSDSLDPMLYHYTVEDLSGNIRVGPEREVIIIDDDGPTILHDAVVTSALKGMPITLEFEVDDNIGVSEVNLVYRYGEGTSTRRSVATTANSIAIEVPRHPERPLWYSFEAFDAAGNSAYTEEVRVSLVNEPPDIDELPTWDVMEETDAEFDLGPYVSDPNDPVLTVSCSDESITIENMVLKVRHDVAVPDRTVLLTFLDGEDQTDADLTIHVVDVNDPPVITDLLPLDGVKYREGKTIEFFVVASDEEADDLTYTWKEGDEVLGTVDFIKYSKLKPGEHTITVVVDDGTDQVEESFTVIVKKEEDTPGFGLVVTLAAVVLTGLAVRRFR